MTTNLPDQTKMWDQKHSGGDHAKLRGLPSPLAKLAEPYFPRHSRVLELGCGVGRDALYFADKGHTVLATDSSSVVIGQNRQLPEHPGVDFEVVDIQDLSFPDGSFAVIYANLSLHYYHDHKTRRIFADLARILKRNGLLIFSCKSKDDDRTRGATEIEPGLFVAPNGHALRLFSIDYTKEVLGDAFDILHIDDVEEVYQGHASSIVRCVAKKKGI